MTPVGSARVAGDQVLRAVRAGRIGLFGSLSDVVRRTQATGWTII